MPRLPPTASNQQKDTARPESVARRRGKLRAQVAVARRLAVIMHRMWIDGTTFRWTRDTADEAAGA